MSLDWYRTRRTEKPIGGFGWRGWIALAVFLGILIPSVSGFNWQFFLLESIWRVWDYQGVYWYILKVMHPLSFSIFYPGFSMLSVLPVMIGMKLAPVRLGLWRYGLLLAASIVSANIVYLYNQQIMSLMGGYGEWTASIVPALIAVGVSFVCTRSWLVSLSWLTMVPLTLFENWYWTSPMSDFAIPLPAMMNTNFVLSPMWVIAFVLPGLASLWWARSLRRELLKPGTCLACGYLVDEVGGGVCPECGTELPQSVSMES